MYEYNISIYKQQHNTDAIEVSFGKHEEDDIKHIAEDYNRF